MQPRIHAHLDAHTEALDRIEDAHQQFADRTDLDLTGETQWAAIWQVAGRCIGFARAVLVLARAGFVDEAPPQVRAAQEANWLLRVVADENELPLLRRWLEDDENRYLRPKTVRAAMERVDRRIAKSMQDAGVDPLPSVEPQVNEVYHRMSQVAHNRREATEAVVSVAQRSMTRGRHGSPFGRAASAMVLCSAVEETVRNVGDALARVYGGKFYLDVVKPMIDGFGELRATMPLDETHLRSLA